MLGIEKIRKTIENLDEYCKVKINAPTGGIGTNNSDTCEDIGELLEMSNIREVIKNFNNKQRCVVFNRHPWWTTRNYISYRTRFIQSSYEIS